MFHSQIPNTVVELYNNIRENNWRELTKVEYASLVNFQSSYLKNKNTQTQTAYYALYLSVAIEETSHNPSANNLWKGLEQNLMSVCKDLASSIKVLNTLNDALSVQVPSPFSSASAA